MPRTIARFLVLMMVILVPVACSNAGNQPPDSESGAPLRIVVTTGMVADVVASIAGEHAVLHQMMGAGTDPHLYTPTRTDMAAVLQADLVFINGHRLEGRLGEVLRGAPRVLALAESLPANVIRSEGDEADPHVWMHVELWAQTIDPVVEILGDLRPSHADEFARRAEAFRAELVDLDRYVREVSGSVPADRRVLITAHDAFGYFGAAYGFEVIGVQGMTTESEAGLVEINRLVARIVRDQIPAIFVESTISERAVRSLVEGARSRGHVVRIGGTLFSDATGPSGTWEGTYIGMIDHNATTVVRSLGGEAPEGGFRAWRAKASAPPVAPGEEGFSS